MNPIEESKKIREIHNLNYFDEHGGSYATCKDCGQHFSVNYAEYRGEDFEDLEPLSCEDSLLCTEDN